MASLATVSILFCDLVGSTELLTRVGEPAGDELRRACFSSWRAAVAARNGTEVKSQGDGLMVSFASAVDAVECAAALQQATARVAGEYPGVDLALRVGISSGEAAYEEDDWFGGPVIEAARLCAAARPGEILAAGIVAMLAKNRTERPYREAGPYILKGLPTPVDAVIFDWQPAAPEPLPMPRPLVRPAGSAFSFFVGRESELDRVVQAWKQVTAGEQRSFFIAGEPGIGKTSLAAEVALRAWQTGATVLYGRCDQELAAAFQPFAEALHTYVVACPAARLARHTTRHLAEAARLVPVLAELVPGLAPPTGGDAEAERRLLFDAVAGLLREIGRDGPVVLVLDDLHWATKPTLLLLRHLMLTPEPVPMLVLGTYRDTDLSRTHPLAEMLADLRRVDAAHRIALRGLDRDEGAHFLEAAAGHALEGEERALADAIHAATEGHPLFLREVLSHLAEAGVIYQRDGRWVTDASNLDFDSLGLPEGVREAISRRLSSLSDTANEVLRAAAVVGPIFEARVLERIPELAPHAERVLDALEQAQAIGLIAEGDVPGSFQFVHALVRQTLRDEVSSARRTRLHRHIGEVLETLPDANQRVDALAHHFAEAVLDGVAEKAADYSLAAAWQALDRAAPEQAIAHAERGLEALDLARLADDRRRSDLHLALGSSVEDLARAKAAIARAAEHARAAGDVRRLAEAAIVFDDFTLLGVQDATGEELLVDALRGVGEGDEALRCRVLAHLARYRFRAKGGEGYELAEEALRLARRIHDDEALAEALSAMFTVLLGSPDLDARMRVSQELGEVERRLANRHPRPRPSHRRWLGGGELNGRGLLWLQRGDRARYDAELTAYLAQPMSWLFRGSDVALALLALLEGRFDDAERVIMDGLADHNERVGQLNNFIAQFLLLRRDQGRWPEVHGALVAGVADNPNLVAFEAGLALAEAEMGRLSEAATLVRSLTADDLARIPRDSVFPSCLALLAVAAATVDDREAAEMLLPHLERYRGQILLLVGFIAALGAADLFEGMLLTTLARFDEAEPRFEAALALHRAVGSPPLEARTAVEYGRLLLRRRDPGVEERGCDLLRWAAATAAALGMEGVRCEAEKLLAEHAT